jgi:ribonuclease-3
MDDEAARGLEERLGYRFADPKLLTRALTHRSRANEEGSLSVQNERLEFLGDAVLSMVVAELLMRAHPDAAEGTLSRARSMAVNTHALARRSRVLGLDQDVRLGRSEETSEGRSKPSILANVLEAVVGAIYVDGGLEPVRALIEREFGPLLEGFDEPPLDSKTRLQELMHATSQPTPSYVTTGTRGPDHAKEFEVEVRVGDRVLAQGRGRSKREAEQEAASAALAALEG